MPVARFSCYCPTIVEAINNFDLELDTLEEWELEDYEEARDEGVTQFYDDALGDVVNVAAKIKELQAQ